MVTLGIREVTEVAFTIDKAICKEALALETELLVNDLFIGVLIGHVLLEDILCDLSLPFSGSTAEVIEIAIKPFVNLLMDSMVVITDLLWGLAFF